MQHDISIVLCDECPEIRDILQRSAKNRANQRSISWLPQRPLVLYFPFQHWPQPELPENRGILLPVEPMIVMSGAERMDCQSSRLWWSRPILIRVADAILHGVVGPFLTRAIIPPGRTGYFEALQICDRIRPTRL